MITYFYFNMCITNDEKMYKCNFRVDTCSEKEQTKMPYELTSLKRNLHGACSIE